MVEHQESYKTITVLKTIEVYLNVDSISLLYVLYGSFCITLQFRCYRFDGSGKGVIMYYDIVESGKRIKEMRKKVGLTQAQLAEKLGISADGMSSIERGKNGVSVYLFGIMAPTLECSVEYLAYGVKTMVLTEQEIRVIMAMRGII